MRKNQNNPKFCGETMLFEHSHGLEHLEPAGGRRVERVWEVRKKAMADLSKSLIVFFVLIFSFLISVSQPVSAQTPDYPISELGNCRNERECQLYCDIPANTPACWSYEKYILNGNVLGEETVNLNYPIPELGSCNSPSECFIFCNQPQNQTTCLEFARSKGLIKEKPKVPENIVDLAKKELGCKSDLECMVFCQLPENMDACRAFGQKYNLVPPPDKRQMGPPPEVMEEAKRELGCYSEASCMNVCNNPDNIERCMRFAKKHKLMDEGEIENQEEFIQKKSQMMEDAKKELGCETPSSCMNFCQRPENMDACMSLAKKHNFGPPPQQMREGQPMQTESFQGGMPPPGQITREDNSIRGPGGCASEKECKEYCQKHPGDCPGFSQSTQLDKLDKFDQSDKASPSKMGDFLGPAGCKTEKECKAYCEKHPSDCPGFPKDKPNTSSFPQPDKSNLFNRPTPIQGAGGPPPNQPPQGGPQNMMNKEQEKYLKEQMKNDQKPPENKSGENQPPQNPQPQI